MLSVDRQERRIASRLYRHETVAGMHSQSGRILVVHDGVPLQFACRMTKGISRDPPAS
jgi:hypothetical protein